MRPFSAILVACVFSSYLLGGSACRDKGGSHVEEADGGRDAAADGTAVDGASPDRWIQDGGLDGGPRPEWGGYAICNNDAPSARFFDHIDEITFTGFSIARNWRDLEPSPGVFDWSYYDEMFDHAEQYGKRIILRTFGARQIPAWHLAVNGGTVESFEYDVDQDATALQVVVFDPAYLELVEDLMTRFAERYAGRPELFAVLVGGVSNNRGEFHLADSQEAIAGWLAKCDEMEAVLGQRCDGDEDLLQELVLQAWVFAIDLVSSLFPGKAIQLYYTYTALSDPDCGSPHTNPSCLANQIVEYAAANHPGSTYVGTAQLSPDTSCVRLERLRQFAVDPRVAGVMFEPAGSWDATGMREAVERGCLVGPTHIQWWWTAFAPQVFDPWFGTFLDAALDQSTTPTVPIIVDPDDPNRCTLEP